ncbi:response regulator [Xanthocytophaga flava]|uniref:response regulator n=1 Tax=Xanthocytophaga flava TaxID=3048013 RepID=UPI0028D62B45|nr:response regulator [Xanthocytophaga flavus]MDJ1468998.1 response regulator [Xanthocytophaga flavus]
MKKTVLVVEDFASIRDFVCEILEKKGYHAIKTTNGNEALEVLSRQAEEISLVLSDYNMPECTGMELLKKIKANPATLPIPVVFLTTESDPVKMRTAKDAGLAAWVRKPYKADTFFALLENLSR